jgi:glycosyltransferase involved in cell wall biosynthesis
MTPDQDSGQLKILICLLYYLPHRTGLTLYVQRLAERLAARGHQVTVVCARHDPATPAESVENGVRVLRLRPVPFAISRGMVLPSYPWTVYRLLRRHDVINVHTPIFESALIRLLSRLTGKPIVSTHHGDLVLPEGLTNRLITGILLGLYRIMAPGVSAFVHHTEDYARQSAWLSPYLSRLAVIPPLVEIPRPDPERVRELRRAWSPDGGPLIGFAGRFVEEKRPDVLIRSLEVVLREHPNARIVFAGQHEIPYESFLAKSRDLVERFRDRLIFLGMLPEPREMADFYAACDVLALTSDTECFALVQVEAMLCGTPVVMTDIPGGRVPVRQTGMGKLAPRGDSRAVGKAILEVLRDRASFVKPAEKIERLYSAEETVSRYEELFRRAADRTAGPTRPSRRPALPEPAESLEQPGPASPPGPRSRS